MKSCICMRSKDKCKKLSANSQSLYQQTGFRVMSHQGPPLNELHLINPSKKSFKLDRRSYVAVMPKMRCEVFVNHNTYSIVL